MYLHFVLHIHVQIQMLKELLSWMISSNILSYSGGRTKEIFYQGSPWLPPVRLYRIYEPAHEIMVLIT